MSENHDEIKDFVVNINSNLYGVNQSYFQVVINEIRISYMRQNNTILFSKKIYMKHISMKHSYF